MRKYPFKSSNVLSKSRGVGAVSASGGSGLDEEEVLDSQTLQASGQGTLVDPGGNIVFNNTDDPGMLYEATSGEATWYSDVKCNEGSAFVRCRFRQHTSSGNSRWAVALFYSAQDEDNIWDDSPTQSGYVLKIDHFQQEVLLLKFDGGSETELASWDGLNRDDTGQDDPDLWFPDDEDDAVIELQARYDSDNDRLEFRVYVTPGTGLTGAGEKFELTNTDGRGRIMDDSPLSFTDTYAAVCLDPAGSSGQNMKARDFEHGIPAEEAAASEPHVMDLSTRDGKETWGDTYFAFNETGWLCDSDSSSNKGMIVDTVNRHGTSVQVDVDMVEDTSAAGSGYQWVICFADENARAASDVSAGSNFVEFYVNWFSDRFDLKTRDAGNTTTEQTGADGGVNPSDTGDGSYRMTVTDNEDGTADVTVVFDPDGANTTLFDLTVDLPAGCGDLVMVGQDGRSSTTINNDGGFTAVSHQSAA